MTYRVTPHTKTKLPLWEVMFNWKIRYTISSVDNEIEKKVHNCLNKNETTILCQQTLQNKNSQNWVKVLVLQKEQNKLTPKFNQYPYVVTEIKETMITTENPVNNHQAT